MQNQFMSYARVIALTALPTACTIVWKKGQITIREGYRIFQNQLREVSDAMQGIAGGDGGSAGHSSNGQSLGARGVADGL
jgi:hypothetical protein